jgi:hypothetical protein
MEQENQRPKPELFHTPTITFRTLGKGKGDDILNDHRPALPQGAESSIGKFLVSQSLQLEITCLLNKTPEQLFTFISNSDKLTEWGSGYLTVRVQPPDDKNENPTRIINEGLVATREVIRLNEFPVFIYSQVSSIMGYENHVCALICVPAPENRTYFVFRIYAEETGGSMGTFCGFNSFKLFAMESMWSLKTIVDDANRIWGQ